MPDLRQLLSGAQGGKQSPGEYLSRPSSWREITSRCLSAVAYHADSLTLAVRLRQSGRVYWYLGVPEMVYRTLLSYGAGGSGAGSFYNSTVKSYTCQGPVG